MTPATMTQESPQHDVDVESKLLGPLSVPTTQMYEFDLGMYGFSGARTFALLPAEREGFFWLQCVEFEALTFLLVDPFRFVDGYSVELDPGDLTDLNPQDASDLLILAILTLPRTEEDGTTVNLQGPIALNLVERRGKQVVVEGNFGVRYEIDLSRREHPEQDD